MANSEHKWPIVPAIWNTAMGGHYKLWLKGCLSMLSNTLHHPVLVVFPNQKDELQAMEEDGREYEQVAPFCGVLGKVTYINDLGKECNWREDYCRKTDKRVAAQILDYYLNDKPLPESMTLEESHNQIEYISYICECTQFTEWAVPLRINSKPVGIFITGQFRAEEFNENMAKDSVNRCMTSKSISKEKINQILEKLTSYKRKMPSENDQRLFFDDILEISKFLNSMYKEYRLSAVAEDEHWVANHVSKSGGQHPGVFGKEADCYEDFAKRFRTVRTSLFEAMFYVKKRFSLKSITVFKPISEGYEEANGRIDAATILCKDMPSSLLIELGLESSILSDGSSDNMLPDRKFEPAQMWIDMNSREWVTMLTDTEDTQTLLQKKYAQGEACRQLITTEAVEIDFSMCKLYSYSTQTNECFAVVYLVEFKSEKDFKESDKYIESIFRSASISFMMQWKAIDADKQRFRSSIASRHITHKLGSIVTGMHSDTAEMDNKLLYALKNQYENATLFNQSYPAIATYLGHSSQYIESMHITQDLISINAKASVFAEDQQTCKMESFYPYDQFLFRWFRTIRTQCKAEGKKLDTPVNIDRYDESRPKMYADPLLMEQIVYNLLSNAAKYSYPGTLIQADCKLSRDGNAYLFTVTNYGEPFDEYDTDIDCIFKRGKRGSNKEGIAGTGFGLYIARKYARLHGGNLTVHIEKLSDYCIPALAVARKAIRNQPEKVTKYEQEIDWLKDRGNYSEILVGSLRIGDHTPTYYERLVDNPTAKITFTCSIPYKRRGHEA